MVRLSLALLLLAAAPAAAFERVASRDAFVALTQGRALTALGIRLNVSPEGGITGRAFGRDVSGSWTWEGGFFCRTLSAGDRDLPRNCQLVERRGDVLRFTADRGAGDTADLRLR
jgi:hypothetical protein